MTLFITVQLETNGVQHTSYALARTEPDAARIEAYFSPSGEPCIKSFHCEPILMTEARTVQHLGIAEYIKDELDDDRASPIKETPNDQ